MRILVHGFYGAGNAGDDAIMEAVAGRARQALGSVEVAVSCYSKRSPEGEDDGALRFVNGRDCQALYDEVKAADLVVVGGGGLFQDYHGFDLRPMLGKTLGAGFGSTAVGYYGLPIILAGLLDKPAVLYAIGAGPFRTKEAAAVGAWLAEGATAITVRDVASAEYLRSLGVSNSIVTADPAVALKPPAVPTVPQELSDWLADTDAGGLKVGLNVRSWAFSRGGTAQAKEAVGALAEHLAREHSARIVYLPFNQSPGEVELGRQLAARAGGDRIRVLPYDGSVGSLLSVLGSLDLVVGMRLHAAVLAAAAGTVPIGIAYDSKVASFFRELGVPGLCLELDGLTAADLKAKVDSAVTKLAGHRATVRRGLRALELRDRINGIVLQRAVALGHNRRSPDEQPGGQA